MSAYSSSSSSKGCISLYCAQVLCLFFQQLAHFLINQVILLFILLNSQFLQTSSIVRLIPRCPCTGLLQCCQIISSYSSSRTSVNIVRMLLSVCASPINLSRLLTSSAPFILSFVPAILLLRLKALARLLSLPRVYKILNLYCPSFLDYLTCLQLSSLVVIKQSRFL